MIVTHLAPGVWRLTFSTALFVQAWAEQQLPPPASGVEVYAATYDRAEPRLGSGDVTYHVRHVVADGAGVAFAWAEGPPIYATWRDGVYGSARLPVWWAGPGDFDADGDRDVFDLLCYLDWWFAESNEPLMLVDFVGRWFE